MPVGSMGAERLVEDDLTPSEDTGAESGSSTEGHPEVRAGTRPLLSFGQADAIRRLTSGFNLSVLEQFQRSVASQLARSQVFQTSKWLESVLPARFELPAMRVLTDTSQTLLGSTSLSRLLAAQEATKRIHDSFAFAYNTDLTQKLGALLVSDAVRAQVLEPTGIADTVSSFMSTLVSPTRPLLVARAVVVGSRAWDEATRLLLPAEDESSLQVLSELGRGTVGIGASGLLLVADEPDVDVDVDVAEWGPGPMHSTLRVLLGELDLALPAKLDGAWERVSRQGPDAESQAASSLLELVDWALRLAAADEVVLVWMNQEGQAGELHEGKPTRTLRLKYLVRHRPGERRSHGSHSGPFQTSSRRSSR